MSPPTDRRGVWVVIALLIMGGYLIFIFSKSVWRNYEINNQVLSLEQEIEELILEREYLKNLIAYYQTKSFSEKEARSKLGLKKKGETVLALPRPPEVDSEEKMEKETATGEKKSNYQKWWYFFFRK